MKTGPIDVRCGNAQIVTGAKVRADGKGNKRGAKANRIVCTTALKTPGSCLRKLNKARFLKLRGS